MANVTVPDDRDAICCRFDAHASGLMPGALLAPLTSDRFVGGTRHAGAAAAASTGRFALRVATLKRGDVQALQGGMPAAERTAGGPIVAATCRGVWPTARCRRCRLPVSA